MKNLFIFVVIILLETYNNVDKKLEVKDKAASFL